MNKEIVWQIKVMILGLHGWQIVFLAGSVEVFEG